MIINQVRLYTQNHVADMTAVGGQYRFADAVLELSEGKVFITGGTTPLCAVELIFSNTYFRDAMILCDAFERAYAELGWKKVDFARKLPWYFLANEEGKTYGFGVKTQPNAICFWQCDENQIILNIDIRNGKNGLALDGRRLEACQIVTASFDGDAFAAGISFCVMMCDAPRLVSRPIYGGNDWYCNYGDNSAEKILRHTHRIVECAPENAPKPFMVIDDGWELCGGCGGPWSSGNSFFGDMGQLARRIEAIGAIPGIWFRPLVTVERVPEQWTLERSGSAVYLDPSKPAVLEKVREDVTRLRDWGYKLIKHDFSTYDIFGAWGFELTENYVSKREFADKTKTTAEIVKQLYHVIREAAGEDVLIIGCNTISHLSAEVFEIQRTGDDTSGYDWERVKNYGVNTLAFRMMQHNTFYSADADCVGITNAMDWNKNRQWLDVLSKSGTPVFVSIGDDAYTPQIREDITAAFEKITTNGTVSCPLDWMENQIPAVWESAFGRDTYNW